MNTPPTTPKLARTPAHADHPQPKPPGARPGKVRPAILLWALGVPIPIVLILLLIRGCM